MNTEEKIVIMQGFVDGKAVQFKGVNGCILQIRLGIGQNLITELNLSCLRCMP